MNTVLVSGASGIVGYGCLRSLRLSQRPLRLIGTTIYNDSVAPAFCDLFVQAPPTNDPSYADWLLSTIRTHQVELIIPGIEIDLYTWVALLPEIERLGCKVLMNQLSLVQLCQDKWDFYSHLRDAGLDCVIDSTLLDDFDTLEARFGLPFLLKPRRGFASKGIVRVASAAAFAPHRERMGSVLMAQPIVGSDDEEYTTAAFGDGQGGWSACMTLRRKLSRDGFTDRAEVVPTDPFVQALQALCALLRPIGPTNFQFRRSEEQVKLLEINPRISSSTSLRAAFGYNESAMAVALMLDGQWPTQPSIRRGKAVRYTDDCIFYDDSLHL